MNKIDLINIFAKMFIISFFIYMIYKKIANYKDRNTNYIIILAYSFSLATLYTILVRHFQPLFTTVILYTIYGIAIYCIIKDEFNYVSYIYACIIAYAIYLLAIILTAIILFIIIPKMEYSNPITSIIILFMTGILFLFLFKAKRFKYGFNFLKNKSTNRNIKIFSVFWLGILLIIFGISQKMNDIILKSCVLIGAIFIILSLIIWIKSQITKTYKSRMRDRTIEIQKTEIDEQKERIERLEAENLQLSDAIHRHNHKLESLEYAMKNALNIESKTEFANELSIILEETKEASRNFANATKINKTKIPLTNIAGIDHMFKYTQEKAIQNNINFDLKINSSIKPLIENTIPKEKFEILLGDHLKDAIIAVNASENTYKSILVTLGLVEGIYELAIYDTGTEFEIETLLKLGEEKVTTHKDEGGTGTGFMTTFETLKECKASLIIEEYNPETTNYTKSVIIRFDGKNEYKICSYRAEKIKEQKHKRRIIIERLK